jgi:hypothetical protein
MPSPKTVAPAPALETPAEPYAVPEGIQLEHKFGAVTGKPMWRVVGFNMPYDGSPEGAVKLYERLKHAYETGYFVQNGHRK